MASLEEQFEAACAAHDLPGVVLVASDSKSGFRYEKAFGMKSPTEKIDINATFAMASCTKLITSIATLQCVERGQIGLDEDLSTILTELKGVDILTGFKEGTEEPILKKAENKITLRHLLTHSSGISSDLFSRPLRRWRISRGERTGKKGVPMIQGLSAPLVFEPGTSWAYGSSTDWAGILVMRLNDMPLEAYMQKYIWDPLEIKNITFHLEQKPEVRKNLVTMTRRGTQMSAMATPSSEKVVWTKETMYDDPVADEWGGGGCIGSAVDYMKILHSICADDGMLLMSETIDAMFTPQLGDGSQKRFSELIGYLAAGKLSDTWQIKHGLAGRLTLNNEVTGTNSWILRWGGLPNLMWSIDRESGLSLMYASNILPSRDSKSMEMYQLFEKEMYRRVEYQHLGAEQE